MTMAPTSSASGIVFVTQLLDPADPVLGFVHRYVRALTARFSPVTVVANEVRTAPADLDIEVRTLGKEDGAGRLRRGERYVAIIDELLRSKRYAGVLAHMCPSYLNLAAAPAKLRGVPLLLWYAHPSVTPALRLADRLADAVLTSLPGSYPIASSNVHVIGQATDVDAIPLLTEFPPEPTVRCVAIGRTSPSKGFATMIKAIHLCRTEDVDIRLRLVGPSTTAEEAAHRLVLEQLIVDEQLEGVVTLDAAVPPDAVVDVLSQAHILINNMVAGSGDKVVFEAMAAGRPVVVSNPSFLPLVEGHKVSMTFPPNDAVALAERLLELSAMSNTARHALGRELRRRVVEAHSLDHWSQGVAHVMSQLSTRG